LTSGFESDNVIININNSMKKIILTISLMTFVAVAYAGEGCPFTTVKPACCSAKDKVACAAKMAPGCSTNTLDSVKASDQNTAAGEKAAVDGKK
jgi:hypothetical protein